ncbi:MAG: DUF420 domain-containing protein [Saprospiraceae bacterium]|jgi:putative membrane protein|nr:DUF420 domain-containing protein [Saprospiraceae bacterium]MBL0025314.1 DUF420 domain-containing protein [Saprospiraceae bacterium]
MSDYPKPNILLAKKLDKISILLTVIILVTVGMMRRVKFDVNVDFSFLPAVSAGLNTIVAICLIFALYFIKNKEIIYHKRAIFTALIFSGLFLISYVVYHFTTKETMYCKEGMIRYMYYFLLISHIVLAGVSLPFILITFTRGFTFQVQKHRRFARWVYPIWLYVAISGPICYLMLKPCYL